MPHTSADILEGFRLDHARDHAGDINLTLRPDYLDLLAKLGNPHQKLPPVFHVAGTNGKGSTCAFLRAMLQAAGHKVHVYTSPHLVHFHERIRIRGELISEEELVGILNECRKHSKPGSISYFEAATAAAFYAFAKHPANYTILEVGLGGRLDATNIVDRPIASIINRISYDHRDYLGTSLTEISREKAGIMRAGVPCFTAMQPDQEVLRTLQDEAAAKQTSLSVGGTDWRVEILSDGFTYSDKHRTLSLPTPVLVGEHQFGNAGLAIAALSVLQKPLSVDALGRGLENVKWPARLQKIIRGNLRALLSNKSELWLDGGHNDSAGTALAQQAKLWSVQDSKSLHLVCGMLTTKNPAEFLGPLAPYVADLQAVSIPGEASSFSADAFADQARVAGIKNVIVASGFEQALKNLPQDIPGRALVCGSLYLAGEFLKQNN